MNKKTTKRLGLIALSLPQLQQKYFNANEQKVDARAVDHKSRLKTAYKAEGVIGIIRYCTPFVHPDKLPQFVSFINAKFK